MLVPEGNPPCGPEKKVSFAIPCGSQILLSHWFAVVQIGPTHVFEGHIHRYLEIIFCDINARTALCILQSLFPGFLAGEALVQWPVIKKRNRLCAQSSDSG